MTSVIHKYDISSAVSIINEGFSFELPSATIDKIKDISKLVGDAQYIKTPVFKKRAKKATSYTTNVSMKKNSNYEVQLSKIVSNINKISTNTYDKLSESIKNIILEIKVDMSDTDFIKIGEYIFDTASSNMYFTELYATLYKDLMQEFEIFSNIINTGLDKYLVLFDKIDTVVDANKQYDEYCNVVVENEKRHSMGKFIACMVSNGTIDADVVLNIIGTLIDKFKVIIDTPNAQDVCEEIGENIKIIVTHSHAALGNCTTNDKVSTWTNITKTLYELSKYNTSDHKSFTKKSLFKFYDIVDILNKAK